MDVHMHLYLRPFIFGATPYFLILNVPYSKAEKALYFHRQKLWKQGVCLQSRTRNYIFCAFQEKRCFAVFSPVFENPFGAILFEAGQLKYSMKILNALEGETFAVQFLGSQDVSVCEKIRVK